MNEDQRILIDLAIRDMVEAEIERLFATHPDIAGEAPE